MFKEKLLTELLPSTFRKEESKNVGMTHELLFDERPTC